MEVDFGASAGSCLHGLCSLSSAPLVGWSDGFFMAAVTAGISLLPHLHLSDQAINSYTKAKAQKAPGCLNTEAALIYIQTDPPLKQPAI